MTNRLDLLMLRTMLVLGVGGASSTMAAAPPCHAISGFVYLDGDGNGLRAGGPTEPGIPADPVELRNGANVVVGSDVTDPNGFYEFLADSTVPAFLDLLHTASVAATATDWSVGRTVPQFDPSLGTLLSVEVALAGSLSSQLKVENTSPTPVTVSATVQGDLKLTAPGVSLTKQLKPLDGALFAADAFDGVIDFGGTSGHDFGVQAALGSATTTLTTPAQLAPYQGVGTVALTGAAQNVTSIVSGGGGIVSSLSSGADALYTVQYHYAPFDCFDPGSYTVRQLAQPGGFVDGLDTAGNVTPIPGSNLTDVIVVTLAGADRTENDFGELIPICVGAGDCNDGNVCTDDTCNLLQNVCVYTPNTASCSDGNACTTGESCSGGLCTGTPVLCDDGDPCNGSETCDIFSGCQNGLPLQCDDLNACNGRETCVPLTGCVAGHGPFLVDSKVAVGNFCTVGGSVGANSLTGSVRLGRGSTTADLSVLTGNKVTVAEGASAWRAEFTTLRLSQQAVVRNSSGPAVLPIETPFCSIPEPFTCGATDVVVPVGGTQTMTPGVYGTVTVLNEGTLMLAPGNYTLCGLRTARAVTIVVDGPGSTMIDVSGAVTFGNLTVLRTDGGAPPPVLRVSGKRVKVSTDSDVTGFVFAPHASLALGHNAKFTGSFCATKAKVSNGSDLLCN